MSFLPVSIDELSTVTGGGNPDSRPGHSINTVQDGLSISCVNPSASVVHPSWQCTVRPVNNAMTLHHDKPIVATMTNGTDKP
jgi:hypothetical protein